MEFDVMTRATTWDNVASLARRVEQAGFSGMLFTEGHQVPWMNIAAASLAAPSLHFSTGIAIAFARSPMVSAEIAWELAQNTRGKFRLGLGSQVKAHIERRYASQWDKPAPQMKDYVQAVKACLAAFRRGNRLQLAYFAQFAAGVQKTRRGNRAWRSINAPSSATGAASMSATNCTACGLPIDSALISTVRPPTSSA